MSPHLRAPIEASFVEDGELIMVHRQDFPLDLEVTVLIRLRPFLVNMFILICQSSIHKNFSAGVEDSLAEVVDISLREGKLRFLGRLGLTSTQTSMVPKASEYPPRHHVEWLADLLQEVLICLTPQ